MNLQEAFEKSVIGVITQGKASVSTIGSCTYRNYDGCKCGVGHLISDEQYERYNLRSNPSVLSFRLELIDQILTLKNQSAYTPHQVLQKIQDMHDEAYLDSRKDASKFIPIFKENARYFAREFDLSLPDCLKENGDD